MTEYMTPGEALAAIAKENAKLYKADNNGHPIPTPAPDPDPDTDD
jgi:hypothetical protein